MKNYFYVPIIVLLSFSVPMILIAADKQLSSQNLSGRINAFAAVKVVELFSSEFCYDCPKADIALNELAVLTHDRPDIVILAEHVDY